VSGPDLDEDIWRRVPRGWEGMEPIIKWGWIQAPNTSVNWKSRSTPKQALDSAKNPANWILAECLTAQVTLTLPPPEDLKETAERVSFRVDHAPLQGNPGHCEIRGYKAKAPSKPVKNLNSTIKRMFRKRFAEALRVGESF